MPADTAKTRVAILGGAIARAASSSYASGGVNRRQIHSEPTYPDRLAARHRAGDGTRTRDYLLGRQALYQLSYSRISRGGRT